MSKLEQLKTLKDQRDALDRELAKIEAECGQLEQIVNETKIRAEEAGVSILDVAMALAPSLIPSSSGSSKREASGSTRQRKERKTKVYKNPHTGETIETKGGNHNMLKAWKKQHGSDEVESWLQR